MNITVWSRAVLYLLYAEQRFCQIHFGEGEKPIVLYATRRAIEHALWFEWQSRHTRHIQILIDQKWIEQSKNSRGIIQYNLTEAARVNLMQLAVLFRQNSYALDIDHQPPF